MQAQTVTYTHVSQELGISLSVTKALIEQMQDVESGTQGVRIDDLAAFLERCKEAAKGQCGKCGMLTDKLASLWAWRIHTGAERICLGCLRKDYTSLYQMLNSDNTGVDVWAVHLANSAGGNAVVELFLAKRDAEAYQSAAEEAGWQTQIIQAIL